jgi:Zn-dependent peptidase ImmA (M78 family)
MGHIKQHLGPEESKLPIAKHFNVPESALRNRLRMGTVPTSLFVSRLCFKEEEGQLAKSCKDVDARLCGLACIMLKELVHNSTGQRFNKENKTAGKD